MNFFERLEARSRQADSLLCIGLDPHLEDLPEQTPAALERFCLRLIEATAPAAAAFKPNAAFFEAFGGEGIQALRRVIAAVPEDIPVILDAKRGDISSTAQAYARAAFETLGADAMTANPYLGFDSLEPMLRDPEKGVFLLCKTSNPGASDFQDLEVFANGDSLPLYGVVAKKAQAWNQAGNLGLVVGATQPDSLHRVRGLAPDLWILAPGVGAQGGDLETALRAGLRTDGFGILLPVSRSLARAQDPGEAAEKLRQAIQDVREKLQAEGLRLPIDRGRAELAQGLLEAGCVRFGSFELKSGLRSPIYIDLRLLAGDPGLLSRAAEAYRSILQRLTFTRLAALPYAALPIGTTISLQGGWPMIYPRKETKEYGTRAAIEGPFEPGEQVVVIDDLATTGGSKFEAIEKLTGAGLRVEDVVVLIDRQSGAREALAEKGFHLHSVFTLNELLDQWEQSGQVERDQIGATRAFLAGAR